MVMKSSDKPSCRPSSSKLHFQHFERCENSFNHRRDLLWSSFYALSAPSEAWDSWKRAQLPRQKRKGLTPEMKKNPKLFSLFYTKGLNAVCVALKWDGALIGTRLCWEIMTQHTWLSTAWCSLMYFLLWHRRQLTCLDEMRRSFNSCMLHFASL